MSKVKYDNCTVAFEYIDSVTRISGICYGRITDIFTHSIPNPEPLRRGEHLTRTVLKCEWYEVEEPDEVKQSRSKLTTVRRNEQWEEEQPYMFLRDAMPRTLSMAPMRGPHVKPAGEKDYFVIIPHHEMH